jgi:hypothetical protein
MLFGARLRRRDWVLSAALVACASAHVPARADDTFVADDGVRRSFATSYEEGDRPARRERHYLRAAGEMVILLGIGSGLYYASADRWEASDYKTVGERFRNLRASFDTSTFNTNALGHPGAGTTYVAFARTNGLSIPMSFVYAAVSSAVWELALEVPENPSLNDFVITPVSGVAIGEVLLHTGDYFNSAPGKPRWYQSVLGLIFGIPQRIHRAIDGTDRPATSLPADSLGYSSYYAHRFDLVAGPLRVRNNLGDSGTGAQIRLNATIVSMPGFLRPGQFAVTFTDGNFVEAVAHANVGNDTIAWELLCDANLFGRYAQNISEGDRAGVASMFAFNTSARYSNRFLLDRRDSYYFAHVAGPAVKLWALKGDFVAKLEGAAHFDVGAVQSFAFPPHSAQFGESGAATTLKMHGYYFGLGWSATARGAIAYKSLELGGRVFLSRFESIDHGDRFPEVTPHPIHMRDRIAELEAWAGAALPGLPLQLRGFFEHLPRTATMGSTTVSRWDQRYGVSLGGLF